MGLLPMFEAVIIMIIINILMGNDFRMMLDERGILNIFMSGTKSRDNLLKNHPNMSKVTVHPSTSLSGVSHIKEPPRGNSEMPEESEGSVDHVVESFGHLNDVEIYPEGTQETNSRKRLVTVIRDIPAIADREQSVRRRRSSVAEVCTVRGVMFFYRALVTYYLLPIALSVLYTACNIKLDLFLTHICICMYICSSGIEGQHV